MNKIYRKPTKNSSVNLFGDDADGVQSSSPIIDEPTCFDHLLPIKDVKLARTLREALHDRLCINGGEALYIISDTLIEMATESDSEIARIRAIELIAKIGGELKDRQEVEISTSGAPTQINIVSDNNYEGIRHSEDIES